MNPARRLRSSGILAALALVVACSRPVVVESEPGPVYTLEVVNPSTRDMTVSYETGGVPTTLGEVDANETRRFVVRHPGMLTIIVVGTEDGTGRVVRREVTLRAGGVVSVRLAP